MNDKGSFSEDGNFEFRKKLIQIIKLFEKHPYMFSEFLMDNNAINPEFKKRLMKAKISKKNKSVNFIDLNEMMDFYENIITDEKNPLEIKNPSKYWNDKLKVAIGLQKYEQAASIRDIMIKKGIAIKN